MRIIGYNTHVHDASASASSRSLSSKRNTSSSASPNSFIRLSTAVRSSSRSLVYRCASLLWRLLLLTICISREDRRHAPSHLPPPLD